MRCPLLSSEEGKGTFSFRGDLLRGVLLIGELLSLMKLFKLFVPIVDIRVIFGFLHLLEI